jgi:hypothetical protein
MRSRASALHRACMFSRITGLVVALAATLALSMALSARASAATPATPSAARACDLAAIQAKEAEIRAKEDAIAKVENEIRIKKEEIAATQEKIGRLKEEIAKAKSEIKRLSGEIIKLNGEINRLTATIHKVDDEIANLAKRGNDLERFLKAEQHAAQKFITAREQCIRNAMSATTAARCAAEKADREGQLAGTEKTINAKIAAIDGQIPIKETERDLKEFERGELETIRGLTQAERTRYETNLVQDTADLATAERDLAILLLVELPHLKDTLANDRANLQHLIAELDDLLKACEAVEPPPRPTTLTTSLSGGTESGETITVPEGTAVSDTATLSGTYAFQAGGSVEYDVYSDGACTKLVKAAGTVTVTKGVVPTSEAETLPSGTYYWQASYGGDKSNLASTSICGVEVETVTP